MKKAGIGGRVRKVLACHLPGARITNDLVVGKTLIMDEGLQDALTEAVPLNLFVNASTTVGELITQLKKEYDELSVWDKRQLSST